MGKYSLIPSRKNRLRRKYYDNTGFDAFVPEFWAQESLAILEENMVMGNLVYRDFSSQVANFGDTVNTRRPGEFEAVRKWHPDDVTIQDASAVNVPVKLNQHIHVSFLIKDGEESLSFKDLVQTYMAPAMQANARFLDRVLLGQYYAFLMNSAGKRGNFSANVKDYILDTRAVMNINKAYMGGRNFVLGPNTETDMLKPEWFTSADKVGDNGTALRNASLGHKLGFDFLMSQNVPSVSGTFTTSAGAINNAAGYAKGDTVLTVDGITGAWATGNFIEIDGLPYQVSAHSETSSNTTSITLTYGLRRAVADNAVITRYVPGAVNNGAGYAAEWYKAIAYDGFSGAKPQVGQMVSFGTSTTVYTIVQTNGTTTFVLDRPLEAAIADDAAVNIGSPGEFNMAFHRNAIALVSRPLAKPRASTGAASAIVNFNGLSMRVVITYNGVKQGHLITLDSLIGVKVLDSDLGAVLVA